MGKVGVQNKNIFPACGRGKKFYRQPSTKQIAPDGAETLFAERIKIRGAYGFLSSRFFIIIAFLFFFFFFSTLSTRADSHFSIPSIIT